MRPDDDEPDRVRVLLAGVVLMIGLGVCVLMAAVTATHQGRGWVTGAPVAAAR